MLKACSVLLVSAVLVTGCGGGGGAASSAANPTGNTPTPTPTPTPVTGVSTPSSVAVVTAKNAS